MQLINHPDGSIKLRIDKVTPADCGAYKVLVENSLGTDSSICAVAVNRKFFITHINLYKKM